MQFKIQWQSSGWLWFGLGILLVSLRFCSMQFEIQQQSMGWLWFGLGILQVFFQDSVQFFYEFWIFLVIFIIFVIGKQMSFDSFIWIFVLLASFTFDFQIIYFENRAWRSFNPFDDTRSCNSKIGLLFIFVVILGFLKFSFRLFNFI